MVRSLIGAAGPLSQPLASELAPRLGVPSDKGRAEHALIQPPSTFLGALLTCTHLGLQIHPNNLDHEILDFFLYRQKDKPQAPSLPSRQKTGVQRMICAEDNFSPSWL